MKQKPSCYGSGWLNYKLICNGIIRPAHKQTTKQSRLLKLMSPQAKNLLCLKISKTLRKKNWFNLAYNSRLEICLASNQIPKMSASKKKNNRRQYNTLIIATKKFPGLQKKNPTWNSFFLAKLRLLSNCGRGYNNVRHKKIQAC